MELLHLLRNNQCIVEYTSPYQDSWSDQKVLENITCLNCSRKDLTTLPPLPNCKILNCYDNQLITLPSLPSCQNLQCSYNQLSTLPSLPNCQILYCSWNQLITLPPLPNCQKLYCDGNQLTTLTSLPNCNTFICYNNRLVTLPPLPNCGFIVCYGNLLPFTSLVDWQKVWKVREVLLQRKYFNLWHKVFIKRRKSDLHLELLWSPDTGFYKTTEEYLHFTNCQKSI